jgi:hypothetical protein
VLLGCGVTAWTEGDAVAILRDKIFAGALLPPYCLEKDIDVRTLDPGHVRPNMGTVAFRGIWFPLGFAEDRR